ncbi:MAG: CRISPR-associated endonuclease Cas2 [Anaerolineae bacterium]|nr:CRISPR-associated endonuclease Cas2 [Anaerolineae bacterium]
MLCLVMYDIPQNKVRVKVADICLDYGLQRVQFSAFMGDLSRNRQEEMMLKIRRRVGRADANVRLIALGEREAKLQKEVIVNGYALGRRSA